MSIKISQISGDLLTKLPCKSSYEMNHIILAILYDQMINEDGQCGFSFESFDYLDIIPILE